MVNKLPWIFHWNSSSQEILHVLCNLLLCSASPFPFLFSNFLLHNFVGFLFTVRASYFLLHNFVGFLFRIRASNFFVSFFGTLCFINCWLCVHWQRNWKQIFSTLHTKQLKRSSVNCRISNCLNHFDLGYMHDEHIIDTKWSPSIYHIQNHKGAKGNMFPRLWIWEKKIVVHV
jgi:hypothetical protein